MGGNAECTYTPTTENCATAGEVCSGGQCVPPQTGGVLISEYVEGSSNNKYIEVWNGSSTSVNLDGYRIRVYSNGAASPSSSVTLAAHVLLPGAVYVVGNTAGTIYTPDQQSGSLTHNGNDAVELVDASLARLDLVGTIGDAAYFAQDVTLVRNAGITVGSQIFDSAEWSSLPTDSHQLGSHTP